VLPLKNSKKKIGLIGPFANSEDLLGTWQFSNFQDKTITIEEGLLAHVDKESLTVVKGCEIDHELEGGINEAINAAKDVDLILLALGESSNMTGEAASKTEISLPEPQLKLAEALSLLGKPIVLILTNGRPLLLDWFEKHMDAIVETWYLGSQAGNAISDVLFGNYNPSGKLAMSFPRKVGQIPVYYNHFNTGRPFLSDDHFTSKYLDSPIEPLYPFGFGLSYTTFEYSNLKLDKDTLNRGEQLTVSVTVQNVGKYAGEEVVQLYIQDLVGSTVRPVKELKRFDKIKLLVGEEKTIHFVLTEEDLKFYTADLTYTAELGRFKVYVGGNSVSVSEAKFELL